MSSRVLNNIPEQYRGVFDSCVEFENTAPVILQLTDMQLIDSSQRRFPDRLNSVETARWIPENVNDNCLDQIRQIVNEVKPDLIIITGDLVYGEFDDSGRMNQLFFDFMDSFNIPWAPCFGNHDNETAIGVDRQCDMLEALPNCLFRRGNVTGFGNYSVGFFANGRLFRTLCMLDTHGCHLAHDAKAKIPPHIEQNQLDIIKNTSESAEKISGCAIPGIVGYHIPDSTFFDAANAKGYLANGNGYIGTVCPAKDGDFGGVFEHYSMIPAPEGYRDFLDKCHIDTMLTGHCHIINIVVLDKNIQYVFGTKTGTYDYHRGDMLGGKILDVSTTPVTVKEILCKTNPK